MRAKRITWSVVVLALGIAPNGANSVLAQTPSPGGSLALRTLSEMKWEPTARPDTARINVFGDSSKGPFIFFSRYDTGWQLPLHFHTNDLRGVILSGTFIIHVSGLPAKELPTGSYFFVPGKTQHTDACAPGPPCIVYFSGDAPLDRINVSGPQH